MRYINTIIVTMLPWRMRVQESSAHASRPVLINLNFLKFLSIHKSSSHVPRLVYIPLSMCKCVRTFAHASPAYKSAREQCTCSCSCAHASLPVLININISQLLSMHTSSSHVPSLVYMPLNMCI